MDALAVQHRAFINAPVATIFRLLTTAEGWCGWFTSQAVVEPRAGGRIRFEWSDFGPDHYTATDEGRVVEVLENRRFSFTWSPAQHETLVAFSLEPRGDGCMLSVEESGYHAAGEDVAVALSVATGWGEALTLLKFYAEHGLRYGSVPRQ
jgi:uncharacterized protein YndB with AHSA1/START domain